MNKYKSYVAEVVEICDNGDAILQLPPELCEDLGWKDGTVLNLEAKNGAIYINEVNADDREKSLDKPS